MFIAYFSWWIIPIFLLIVGKVKWNKYPIEAIIIEKRGDNIIKVNDRIGRWFDKETGFTRYRLQKMGDVIDVIPFENVLHSIYKPTNIFEWLVNKLRPTAGTVHLLKYGSKQYKPVKITRGEETHTTGFQTIKDKEGKEILVERVLPFDIRNYLGVLNFDVIDWDDVNCTLSEIEASRLRRLAKYESWAKFVIPVAMIAVVGVLCIIFIYLSYNISMETCQIAAQQVEEEPMQAPLANGNTTNLVPILT